MWEESEQRYTVASMTAPSVPITAFTEEAREAVVLARAHAHARGEDRVGTEHLLLGLLDVSEDIAASVLGALGVTVDAVRADMLRMGASSEPAVGGVDAVRSGEVEDVGKMYGMDDGAVALSDRGFWLADRDFSTRDEAFATARAVVSRRCGRGWRRAPAGHRRLRDSPSGWRGEPWLSDAAFRFRVAAGPGGRAGCRSLHRAVHRAQRGGCLSEHLGDDLLACVLGGVYTDVEKTMIEIQRSTMVQETRNAFQNAMRDKFIKAVERLTGRHVLVFMSNHHVGPDIEIELFLLTPNGGFEPDENITA